MCSPVPIKIIGLLVAATLQENHMKCVGKKKAMFINQLNNDYLQ